MEDSRFCRSAACLCAGAALALALASCAQGWTGDARAINKKKETASYYVSEIELDEKTVSDGIDPFTHDTSNCGGCSVNWNTISYQFDGSKFDDTWVLPNVSFDSDNITQCVFDERSEGWTLSYALTNEYTYDASDEGNKTTSVYEITINPMTVYQYRGKNPLVAPESDYNKEGGRMSRFRFYRMTGNAFIDLDQFLLAVDTCSKFAFVYGRITGTSEVVGNLVPTKYEPVELHGEGDDKDRPFYEYDPIGYVDSDGTVVLYEQYEADMGKGEDNNDNAIYYMPSIHSEDKTMASRSASGIGRSPYYPGLYESGHSD